MARKKRVDLATIKNIVVVSDLHCGCRLGLCPDWGANLDDGGAYLPSRLQRVVWDWWTEFWDTWVPQATRGEPYAVVINGDVIDGVHHRATTQISHNLEDQCNIAHEVLLPVVKRCEGRFFMVRGTPAHTGEQGVQEERLAKWLEAIPNVDGQHARYELWKTFGNGKLIHFNHHIGTTSSSAHETSAINAELATAFVEAGRWGKTPPNVVVRSHRHRCAEIRIPSNDGYSISVVTPAWQLKTPFAFKVAGARQTMPQIGGILIRQGDEELYTRFFVKSIERPRAE